MLSSGHGQSEVNLAEKFAQGLAIKVPTVGFGCSSLTGSGRRNAFRNLEAAYEAGVRHFDVARYYGFGESEEILGSFLKRYRSQVTITTKFGIEPPKRTLGLSTAIGVGRRIVRFLPALRTRIQRTTQAFVKTGAFRVEEARASLETSLRELKTDYVDYYLLHDYCPGPEPAHKLLMFLESAVKAGKVRRFGIGTSFESVLQTIERQPRLCDVVQFQNCVLTRTRERLRPANVDRLVITHGSLGSSYGAIRSFLMRNVEVAQSWTAELGIDVLNHGQLSSLMLLYAAHVNPGGLVLFSSRDPARVVSNAKALLESNLSASQVSKFATLVDQEHSAIVQVDH